MRVESRFVPTQPPPFLSFKSDNADNSFSKDAEIAEKTIQMASGNVDFGEALSARRGIAEVTPLAKLLRANLPTPDSNSLREKQLDGHFVGANGQTFGADTNLSDVPAVQPHGGARNSETLIYINGISTSRARQAESLQNIADTTGSRLIGIHNSTQGGLLDVAQSLGDKLDVGNNPAVNTLADTVYQELKANRPVHLFAHSQGGIITSRALQDVSNRLRLEDGMSKTDAENLLANVKVETFGGASRRYPDGPEYVHYINKKDLVPQLFGLREFLNPLAHEGRGAITHYFKAGSGVFAHGLEEIYLPERVSFEAARRNDFN